MTIMTAATVKMVANAAIATWLLTNRSMTRATRSIRTKKMVLMVSQITANMVGNSESFGCGL